MTAQVFGALPAEEFPGEPPWLRAARRLVRRRAAMIGLAVALFFILLAMAAPLLAPYDPLATNWAAVRKAPSVTHLFGPTKSAATSSPASSGAAAPRYWPGSSRSCWRSR